MMQFQIRTGNDTVTMYADVVKIEVEDIISPDEDAIVDSCSRTIRFISSSGETIEVFCEARDEQALTLHSVKPRY
jgi:hypothetical protein